MTKGESDLCTAAPLIWIIGICFTAREKVARQCHLFTVVVDTEKLKEKTMSAVEVKFALRAE